MVKDSRWWEPHIHGDRRPFLLARGRVREALRRYFAAEGFVEVEAAALQVSPGNEAHLHAFATDLVSTEGKRATSEAAYHEGSRESFSRK